MPVTCVKWPDVVNSCVYHARQICKIYQALPDAVDFKAPEELVSRTFKAFS